MNYEALPNPSPSSLKMTCSRAGTSADYKTYLYGDIIKNDRFNDSTLLDFALAANINDANFVPLRRGDYITVDSVTFPHWFTGYITSDPEYINLGKVGATSVWGYKLEAASDDVILGGKPLGILAPYLNKTMGDILIDLIAQLGYTSKFSTDGVQDGQFIARYVPDPTKRFGDVLREFADSANYRWYAKDRKLFFLPQDQTTSALVLDGNDRQFFTPDQLVVRPATEQIINDAIVLGDIEPQGFMSELFMGTGNRGTYPLLSSIFGIESAVLIDETFQGSSIDEQKWNVNDNANNWLQPANGFLNFLGGSGNGTLDIFLQSASLLPLDGYMRYTHGDWDFVDNATAGINGVICGLWNSNPSIVSGAYPGCYFGIEVSKSGSVTTLSPIVNGVKDPSQSMVVDFSKRYVIRTIAATSKMFRTQQHWAYMGQDGTVGSFGGGGDTDSINFYTILTAIDPTTGNVTSSVQWTNNNVPLTDTDGFSYYIPGASNDLHATVSNITVSIPMQASLTVKPSPYDFSVITPAPFAGQGGNPNTEIPKVIGPNEVDSYDGMNPVATIAVANQGVVTKNSSLGAPTYNPGHATLEFFNDPSTLTTTMPQAGDLVKVTYRRAGVAIGRVSDAVSIAAEASFWGDTGVRSIARKDLSPSPRTSEECEAAAAAIVSDLGYRHYTGTYVCQSPNFGIAGEPVSGTVIQVRNLPAAAFTALPVQALTDEDGNPLPPPTYTVNLNEIIQEVSTTILSGTPEIFEHTITFGRGSRLNRFLSKIVKQTDVFAPQDTAEIPFAVDKSAVGQGTVDSVTSPTVTAWDANSLYIDAGQAPPSSGGFEVRYTDDSWGVDAAKNLAMRSTARAFTIPRNARGKVCFIRAYDQRNNLFWSDDFTQSVWVKTNATVNVTSELNPDGDTSQICTVNLPVNAKVVQTSNVAVSVAQLAFSASIKGSSGQQVKMRVLDSSNSAVLGEQVVTLNGDWQRFTLQASGVPTSTGNAIVVFTNVSGSLVSCKISRASLEPGTSTETIYAKTSNILYGATSRYSAGLKFNLPMIPNPPTATVDTHDITAPVITINLPDFQQDVWGFEIRAQDNQTVVWRANLVDSGFVLQWVNGLNKTRNLSYFIYTYNLLGEYCAAPFNLTETIPFPTVMNIVVDENTKRLTWVGVNNAAGFEIEMTGSQDYLTNGPITKIQSDESITLEDHHFFWQSTYTVTAYDDIGKGIPVSLSYVYAPLPPSEVNSNEINSVNAPNTPHIGPTRPPNFNSKYGSEYDGESFSNYAVNRYRYD
jgi:hypothetical protein